MGVLLKIMRAYHSVLILVEKLNSLRGIYNVHVVCDVVLYDLDRIL